MIQLLAETHRDQEIIDNLQRALDQLKKHKDAENRKPLEEI